MHDLFGFVRESFIGGFSCAFLVIGLYCQFLNFLLIYLKVFEQNVSLFIKLISFQKMSMGGSITITTRLQYVSFFAQKIIIIRILSKSHSILKSNQINFIGTIYIVSIINTSPDMRTTLLLTVVLLVVSAPLNPKKVIAAINCGSSEVISSSEGIKYTSDANIVEGDSREADYTTNSALEDVDIKFTFDKDIYMHERHTYSQMTYNLPVKDGFNTLILKFAEMYFNEKGKRVFDVSIGSTVILKNFDVVAEGGKFSAIDKYIQIQMREGQCYFDGKLIKDGVQKGKLKLKFSKGKADNPIIQGIVVYHSSLKESNQNQYTILKTKWAQQKEMVKAKKQQQQIKDLIAVQKKREKIVIRNDQLQIVQQQDSDKGSSPTSRQGKLRYLLMSPLGVLIWAVVIFCGLVFVYNNVFLMGSQTSKTAS